MKAAREKLPPPPLVTALDIIDDLVHAHVKRSVTLWDGLCPQMLAPLHQHKPECIDSGETMWDAYFTQWRLTCKMMSTEFPEEASREGLEEDNAVRQDSRMSLQTKDNM